MGGLIETRSGPRAITERRGSGRVLVARGENTAEAARQAGIATAAATTAVADAQAEIDADVTAAAASATAAAASAAALPALAALYSDAERIGTPDEPVTGAASANQTFAFGEPTSGGLLSSVTLYAAAGGTVRVRRFSKTANAFAQLGADIVLTVVAGLNTFAAPTDFPLTFLGEGEHLGVYGSAVLAVPAVNADNGGVYIGTGNVTNFTDSDVFTDRAPQVAFTVLTPKTRALERHIERALMPAGVAPDWVQDVSAVDIDFRRGLVWNPTRNAVEPITQWIETFSEAGFVVGEDGSLDTRAANEPRITPRGVRIDGQEVRNIFVDPLAPATQVVSGSGTLQVWGEGEITFPLNNGRTGRAKQGQSATVTASIVTFPLTLTVVGSLVAASYNAALNKVSPTAENPRPGDQIKMTAKLMAALNGAAGTVLIEADDLSKNAARILGGAGSIGIYRGTSQSQVGTTNGATALTVTNASANLERIARLAVAHDGAGRSIALGGASATDANVRGTLDLVGRSQTLSASFPATQGWLRRMQIWPTRKSDAELQLLTAAEGGLVLTEINYASSIDPLDYPALGARICYDPGNLNAPIVVLMHGFSQSARDFTAETLARFAQRGYFAIAVEMRGGPDANLSDASGREIMDIADAVAYVRDRFAQLCSADLAFISGYSGGGGNAFACAMKLPDLFAGYAVHFGMSDYGFDGTYGWYYTDPGFAAGIEARIGVAPGADVTGKYRSRYAIEGVPANLQGGHMLIFHDELDTSVDVEHSRQLVAAMAAAANTRYSYYESDSANDYPALYWDHGLPSSGSNRYSEEYYLPKFRSLAPWTVPAAGNVRVHGFLVTKRFSIWLGDGTEGVATVAYDTATGQYTVTPVTPASVDVEIVQGGRSVSATVAGATALTVVA